MRERDFPGGSARRPGDLRSRLRWASVLILSLAGFGLALLPPASGGAWAGEAAARIGEPAPDFSLPSTAGGEVSLAAFRGRKAIVLVFYMGQH